MTLVTIENWKDEAIVDQYGRCDFDAMIKSARIVLDFSFIDKFAGEISDHEWVLMASKRHLDKKIIIKYWDKLKKYNLFRFQILTPDIIEVQLKDIKKILEVT